MAGMIDDATRIVGDRDAVFSDEDAVESEVFRGKESSAGRWTQAEHDSFVKGLKLYDKQWKLIAELIKTRTVVQVRTHAQKYFQKLLKQAKSDGTPLSEDAYGDLFNVNSIDAPIGLKRKNPISLTMKNMKNKMNKSESQSQLSLNVPCILKNAYPYSKSLGYKIGSPSPRSICDSDLEPYLNAYLIQPSNGSNYPQNDLQEPDWLDIPQPPPQPQRFNVAPSYNPSYLFNYQGPQPIALPSQMSYTHGIENRITNNFTQSYTTTTTEATLEPFPDFLGLQNEDLDWLVNDMEVSDIASHVQVQPKQVLVTFDVKTDSTTLDTFINNNMSGHKSDSSEAHTSYEESESQTSSEDGCIDEFDVDQPMESVYEGTNSQNILVKSNLSLNNMYNSYPMTMTEVITSIDNGASWLQGDEEDLVSGIVEAFLS